MAIVHRSAPAPRRLPKDPSKWTEEESAEAERFYAHEEQYQSFAEYARAFWPEAEPGAELIWGRHMQAMCDEMQALYEESERRRALHREIMQRHKWGLSAAEEVNRVLGVLPPLRLVILVPPRHSKSTLLRLFFSWVWLHRPGMQILFLSCMDSLVEDNGSSFRDIIWSDRYAEIQRHLVRTNRLAPAKEGDGVPLGASFTLRADTFAKTKSHNTLRGRWEGHMLGGRFTGVNSDLTGIDDPHDVIEALSETASEESKSRAMREVTSIYRDKVQDRQNNRFAAMQILIMQRVHLEDLAAFWIARGARVVFLPARHNPTHPLRYEKDWRTEPGEPLDPLRQPENTLQQIEAGESQQGWAAKYLLVPVSADGTLFLRSFFHDGMRYDGDPHTMARLCDEVVLSLDGASKTGARNDYTSIGIIGRAGRRKIVLDRKHFKGEFPEVLAAFDDTLREWPEVGLKLIEDKSVGTQLIQARRDTVPGILPVTPKGDKESRIGFVVTEYRQGNVYHPADAPWTKDLEDRLVATGGPGAHDDDADMLAQVFIRWAQGAQPWLTGELRATLVDVRPPVTVLADTQRWETPKQVRQRLTGRPDPSMLDAPLGIYVGIVPGWAHGQAGGEAVAAIVDERGVLLALVETKVGGLSAFAEALSMELHVWGGATTAHYAELPGMPALQCVSELRRYNVDPNGRGPSLSGRPWTKANYKYAGQRGAGYTGDKVETSALWATFLTALSHGLARCRDARTMADLELVVEERGIPSMPDKTPVRGRALAFLLAVEGAHIARREAITEAEAATPTYGAQVIALPRAVARG